MQTLVVSTTEKAQLKTVLQQSLVISSLLTDNVLNALVAAIQTWPRPSQSEIDAANAATAAATGNLEAMTEQLYTNDRLILQYRRAVTDFERRELQYKEAIDVLKKQAEDKPQMAGTLGTP